MHLPPVVIVNKYTLNYVYILSEMLLVVFLLQSPYGALLSKVTPRSSDPEGWEDQASESSHAGGRALATCTRTLRDPTSRWRARHVARCEGADKSSINV